MLSAVTVTRGDTPGYFRGMLLPTNLQMCRKMCRDERKSYVAPRFRQKHLTPGIQWMLSPSQRYQAQHLR